MKFLYGKQEFRDQARAQENTFLLTNGLGGYCSLSAAMSAARGDHALLMACLHAPTVRYCMVHRLWEQLETNGGCYPLTTQDFGGHQPAEEGWRYLSSFVWEDGPVWTYDLAGVRVVRRIGMARGQNTVAVEYTVENTNAHPCRFTVTPWFQFLPKGGRMTRRRAFSLQGNRIASGGLQLFFDTDGRVEPFETVYQTLFYRLDAPDGRRPTGLAAANHRLCWQIPAGAQRTFSVVYGTEPKLPAARRILADQRRRARMLQTRCGLHNPAARQLAAAADAYVVERASTGGKTIMAGYPFFTDWGRDTMIALAGCTLTTGRLEEARSILRTFMAHERDGLMPNLFPEGDEPPRYNTVDAALLFVNCIWLYHCRTGDADFVREAWPVMSRILDCYRQGTRYGIGMGEDGLIHAGEGFFQLTWMDVRIGDHLPTPRHGKPVEINAYWYNALRIMARLAPLAGKDGSGYDGLADRVGAAFRAQFWRPEAGCLRDLVSGTPADEQIRCNQIWAVSVPFTPLTREQAGAVVRTVYRELYTPCGLRTLSPGDPQFHPNYGGPQRVRDLAYHQGTVWPFPLGGFYLAWLRVNGFSAPARRRVEEGLETLQSALREGCAGQLPEIYDGGAPSASKGCFAQAWSVGELLRVYEALERPEAAGLDQNWAEG